MRWLVVGILNLVSLSSWADLASTRVVNSTRMRTVYYYPATTVRAHLGPVLGLIDLSVKRTSQITKGIGGIASLEIRTGRHVFLGLESGYLAWNTSSEGTNDLEGQTSFRTIPVLGSFVYRFGEPRSSTSAYLGASLGVGFTHAKSEVTTQGNSTAVADKNSALLSGFARPGVEFGLSRSAAIFVEARTGAIGEHVVFLPRAGAMFSF